MHNRILDINCQHHCDGNELLYLKILQCKVHTVSITSEGIRKMTFSIHITLEGTILLFYGLQILFHKKDDLVNL